MFCRKCGNELEENSIFCSRCGERVNVENISDVTNEDLQKNNSLKTMGIELRKTTRRLWAENKKKKPVLAVIIVILLVCGYLGYRKIAVEIYEKKAYPVYEAAVDRFNDATYEYNDNRNHITAEKSDRAGLDMIEACLDIYKGQVKVQGWGDYSGMNEKIEEIIALVEDNHTKGKIFLDSKSRDYFETRMAELRAEWRRVKKM